MSLNFRSQTLTRIVAALLLLIPSMAFAETEAGDACTAGEVERYKRTGGPETSGVGYVLVCDGSTWLRIMEFDMDADVGVKQAAPQAPLHIGGEVIVGVTTGLDCDAGRAGALRYNAPSAVLEMCDAATWQVVGLSSCDNSPTYPFFEDQTNLAVSTLTSSNIVQITGIDTGCTTSIGISGTSGSNPEYRVCSTSDCSSVDQTWTNSNSTLALQGKYVQIRGTSSASLATAMTVTLDVGSVSSDWNISTGLTDCYPEGTVCSDGTVYAGLSGAATPMYVTRCDAGQSWNGSACTGTRSSLTWNNGNSTGFTSTNATSPVDGQTNTATIIGIDSDSVVGGTQPHVAAQYCADLVLHGHSDWYLPASSGELITIYNNRTAIGGFDTSGSSYWSSRESDSVLVTRVRFSDGNTTSNGKNGPLLVRCARR